MDRQIDEQKPILAPDFDPAFWLLCDGVFDLDDYIYHLVRRGKQTAVNAGLVEEGDDES